jgi:mono/diheme cytochrome c family protein
VFKNKSAEVLAQIMLLALTGAIMAAPSQAADEPKQAPAATAPATDAAKPAGAAAPAAAADAKAAEPAPAAAGGSMTAGDRVKATEKGKLKNPYTGDAKAIEEGKKLYLANSCNGCHGGGGGGGMCPPLTNQIWVYGSDDDTLFRLITQGSKDLQAAGYKRKGSENVVGPMPGYHEIITKEDDLWKIIAWIRSTWTHGDAKKNW